MDRSVLVLAKINPLRTAEKRRKSKFKVPYPRAG
jgi:hypothetical protein